MTVEDLLIRHQALKGYGRNAEEVLETCRMFAAAERDWPAEEVYEFQKQAGINAKFWPKLIAINNDRRLDRFVEKLPAHINSLYELTRFTYSDFMTAVEQEIITPQTSARALQDWRKLQEDPMRERRQQEYQAPEVTIRVNWHEITDNTDALKKALQELGRLPYVQLLERYSKSAKETLIPVAKIPKATGEAIKEQMQDALEVLHREAAAVDLKKHRISEPSDFCNLSLKVFKVFLVRIVGSTDDFWCRCGSVYLQRIALEICQSDSYPERNKLMALMVRLSRDHQLQETCDDLIEKLDGGTSDQQTLFTK